MAPDWLVSLAMACVALGFLCAAVTIVLVFIQPQKMAIMNVVWPVTALYWGPVSVWALWDIGSPPLNPRRRIQHERMQRQSGHAHGAMKPFWQQVAVAATHCGAGCTLGDIVGEWLVYAFGWKLFGHTLYAEFVIDFLLAFGLGVIFQYATIAPMRGLSLRDGIIAALKADTVSIVAFEIGLFGWMAVDAFVLFPGESIASWNHWFQMQIGMIAGFFTSYPANWFLIRQGVKEGM